MSHEEIAKNFDFAPNKKFLNFLLNSFSRSTLGNITYESTSLYFSVLADREIHVVTETKQSKDWRAWIFFSFSALPCSAVCWESTEKLNTASSLCKFKAFQWMHFYTTIVDIFRVLLVMVRCSSSLEIHHETCALWWTRIRWKSERTFIHRKLRNTCLVMFWCGVNGICAEDDATEWLWNSSLRSFTCMVTWKDFLWAPEFSDSRISQFTRRFHLVLFSASARHWDIKK